MNFYQDLLYSYYVKRTRRAAFRMLITKFINQRTAKRLPTIVRRVWLSIIKVSLFCVVADKTLCQRVYKFIEGGYGT